MGTVRLGLEAMATRFELVIPAQDERRARAAGEEALLEVERFDRMLSAFDKSSPVRRCNEAKTGTAVRVGPELFDLIRETRELWRDSRGGFDPTLGRAMATLGFRKGRRLDAAVLATRSPGFDAVELREEDHCVRLLEDGVALDFGAVGKGLAIDAACGILEDAGITDWFLHGGSSAAKARGQDEPGLPWTVLVSAPGGGRVLARIPLDHGALGVSAPKGRRNARGEGHILDPGTRAPASGILLAAVLHRDAAFADALSTAAVVGTVAPGDLVRGEPLEGLVLRDDGSVRSTGRFSAGAYPPD